MTREELTRRYHDLLIRYVDLLAEHEKMRQQLETLEALGVSIETEREDSTDAD